MSEVVSIYTPSDATGAFRVVAPYVGDIVGAALHRAYDDLDRLPDDMLHMLDCLDRID